MSGDIKYYREQFKRQKKLEEIVSKRVLKRPKTKKWHIFLLYLMLPPLCIAAAYAVYCAVPAGYRLPAGLFGLILIAETYLMFCLIQSVKCYQHYAGEDTRRKCMCIPSCSEYAVTSLKKIFPLVLALLKILKRLFITCDGTEYKVDFPCRKAGERFEKRI